MQGHYDFLAQDRVIFGVPAAEAVLDTALQMNAKRVFLVTSQTLSRKTDVIDQIRKRLGQLYSGLFDECIAHVPRESVLRAAAIIKKVEPDLIVTVGGGTPIDTVKVLLLCLAQNVQTEKELDKYRIRVLEDGTKHIPFIEKPPVRQIVVPTTLSGAEFSNLAGCSDPVRQVKDLYTGHEIGAQIVILDPKVTIYTPEKLWLSTGIRAIDHAVETICSRKPQPFTDATCLHALKLLSDSLKRTKNNPDDLDSRLQSQLGVWLASTGLGRVEWGASHGIGHQLGAVANVSHGYTSCILLHNVLRYNRPVNSNRQAMVSQALGTPEKEAAELIKDLILELEMPWRLRDVGVKREQFSTIADGSMQNMMVRSNPRTITNSQEIIEILEQAY